MQIRFSKELPLESGAELGNPGCGWYHIYTFTALPREGTSSVEEETWLDEECKREQLALVLVDIGHFRSREFSERAVLHIREILDFFRKNEKQMILRFAYDIKGAGASSEPSDIRLIKRHMEQLGGMLCRFSENILVIQGIFAGSWGEMHGSRFLGERDVCDLLNTLYRVTEGKCYLAVRTPAQWRMAAESSLTAGGVKEKLALYNDGIFGSPTDLGTYGVIEGRKAEQTERWHREDELEWQETHVGAVPNGGEALAGLSLSGYRQAAALLGQMHISYLNSIYQKERLEGWKAETVREAGCFEGMSGYEYIGRHLGYRFVVRDVKAFRAPYAENFGGMLRLLVTVENCGMACLTERADCYVICGDTGKKPVDTDARRWRSGQKIQIQAAVPVPAEETGTDGIPIFLELRRRRDGRILRFANEGAGECVLLGTYSCRFLSG